MRPGPLRVTALTPWTAFVRVRVGAALVSLAALCSLEVAAATPTTATLWLEWTAPVGCPRAQEVRTMTARLLGRSLDEDAAAPTRVKARVRAVAGGYQLTIETRTSAGTDTRRLQDPRCVVLAESTAMITATAIDPTVLPPSLPAPVPASAGDVSPGTGAGAVAEAPGELSSGTGSGSPGDLSSGTGTGAPPGLVPLVPGAATEPVLPPAPDLAPGTGAAVTPAPAVNLATDTEVPGPPGGPTLPRRPPLRLGLRFGGLFDLGSTPGPTGGLTIGLALLGRLWRAELFGMWLAPRTRRPDPAIDVGAQVGLLAGGLRGCLVPMVRRVEIPVCAGVEAGVLRGRGVGMNLGRVGADDLPWIAASAGPGLAWAPVRQLALTLQVDLVVPMTRTSFVVRGYGPPERGGEVYAGAPVAGRATLGLELRFR